MSKCELKPRYEFCADCIHHQVCMWQHYPQDQSEHCQFYKDKSLCVELPCEIGETVYHITICKEFQHELDGTLYDSSGGYGTATGYYCPCEIRDNCPFDDKDDFCCEKQKDKLAIFEDEVKGFDIGEYDMVVFLEYTGNVYITDFGKTVFLTKEDAEAKLKESEGK